METWFRRTFNLAPTDQRYLDATPEIIATEYHTHFFDDLYRQNKLDDYVEDDNFEQTLSDIASADNDQEWEDPDEC